MYSVHYTTRYNTLHVAYLDGIFSDHMESRPVFVCILHIIQCVPLATEPVISLIILPLMRILQRNLKQTTDTFLFISHTTNVLVFKFRCNIFIGVRIIKEMPGSVASGTHCIKQLRAGIWCSSSLRICVT